MNEDKYTAINIQYPISELILSGEKTIETRTYPIPKKYIGVPLLVVETPGKNGDFKARIVGIIQFQESFKYKDKKAFYKDESKHKVNPTSPWRWDKKAKWGWPIKSIKRFKKSQVAEFKKGIIFTAGVRLNAQS